MRPYRTGRGDHIAQQMVLAIISQHKDLRSDRNKQIQRSYLTARGDLIAGRAMRYRRSDRQKANVMHIPPLFHPPPPSPPPPPPPPPPPHSPSPPVWVSGDLIARRAMRNRRSDRQAGGQDAYSSFSSSSSSVSSSSFSFFSVGTRQASCNEISAIGSPSRQARCQLFILLLYLLLGGNAFVSCLSFYIFFIFLI